MKIKFPTHYEMSYPKENKKYYNEGNKAEIRDRLYNISKGYCMYCGNKIKINNREYGQVEHSVERSQGGQKIKYLTHCKFNMSIVCSNCNNSLKKKNILPITVDSDYECYEKCEKICKEYSKNYKEHINKNRIILMPYGIKCKDIDEFYEIDYNLLRLLFTPAKKDIYNSNDIDIIRNHIERFGLNSSKTMPIQILEVCEDVLRNGCIPLKGRYDNVIADIFIDYLNGIIKENVIKLCEIILIVSSI